jgi:ABC-type maltose transport system permease subunit
MLSLKRHRTIHQELGCAKNISRPILIYSTARLAAAEQEEQVPMNLWQLKNYIDTIMRLLKDTANNIQHKQQP